MAKKAPKGKKVSTKQPARSRGVRVKSKNDVVASIERTLAFNLHGRYNSGLSKTTQKKLVAYGPWISTFLIIVLLPELIILAKDGSLLTFTGFFDTIFFNQQSWVVMLILLANILLLVDGIGDLFEKKRRGWERVYQASLLSGVYILWQLVGQLSQPAAPILSFIGLWFILFALLDIKEYYA